MVGGDGDGDVAVGLGGDVDVDFLGIAVLVGEEGEGEGAGDVGGGEAAVGKGEVEGSERDGEAVADGGAQGIGGELVDPEVAAENPILKLEVVEVHDLSGGEGEAGGDAVVVTGDGEDAGPEGGVGGLLDKLNAERLKQRERKQRGHTFDLPGDGDAEPVNRTALRRRGWGAPGGDPFAARRGRRGC